MKYLLMPLLLMWTFTAHAGEALNSKTQMADLSNRKLAYRSIGKGTPLILANRFRGDLDKWDPAFLDALAKNHRVITFDYRGLGRSTGKPATTHLEMAEDVRDLAKHLGVKKFGMVGWSLGGYVAQLVVTEFPDIVTHGVLIGTRPPGADVPAVPKRFFEYALKPNYGLSDEVELFFSSKYPASKAAAAQSHARIAQRTQDKDTEFTKEQWESMLKATGFSNNAYGTLEKMMNTKVPLFVLVGEDDISFPVEDWFARKGKFPTAQIIYLPQTGHGPQHQYPELSANYIHTFLTTQPPQGAEPAGHLSAK